MPPKPLLGHDSHQLQPWEGRPGYVWLKATIPAEVKTALVRQAENHGTTLVHEVRIALLQHLENARRVAA